VLASSPISSQGRILRERMRGMQPLPASVRVDQQFDWLCHTLRTFMCKIASKIDDRV